MNRVIAVLGALLLLSSLAVPCHAQSGSTPEKVENFNQWFTLAGTYQFSPESKWAAYMETHWRVANLGADWQQWVIRPAMQYRLNKTIQLSVGYSWLRNFPYGEQAIAHTAPEHNVWQEVLIKHPVGPMPVYHRLRVEERFIGVEQMDPEQIWHLDHFNYANRFRYRIGGSLAGKGKLQAYQFVWFNEAFVDFHSSAGGYYWNQNWLFAGIGRKINAQQQVQLGYQYQWLRKGDGIHQENNHIIQATWKINLVGKPTKS